MPDLGAALVRLSDQLQHCLGPNEQAFIALGDVLMAARSRLGQAGEGLKGLSARMGAEDGATTGATLEQARLDLHGITGQTRAVRAALDGLSSVAPTVGRPLSAIAKIIGEIAALATNAKIQAAQVRAGEVDFSVFTRDIDRLRLMAGEAVRRAETRLGELAGGLGQVQVDAQQFGQGDAQELERIAAGLAGRLGELARRRQEARRALDDFQRRADTIAQRVERCVGALQINDLTSQRVAHVQTALGLLRVLCGAEAAAAPGLEWMDGMGVERRQALVAAVCRLQGAQLERAGADFRDAVAEVRADMDGLAADAAAIRAEAQRVFGGDVGEDSFVRAIAADIGRAAQLLRAYCTIDDRIRAGIDGVSAGFVAMAEDVRAIQSIDTDMRVMGLNATLKCTRLGASGVALGVVAQELRACSRRTEETARAIDRAISAAAERAAAAAATSLEEYRAAADLSARLGAAAEQMIAFSGDFSAALHAINLACGEAGTLLRRENGANTQRVSAPAAEWDQRFIAACGAAAASLTGFADAIGPGIDTAEIRDDVSRLLGGHYTMASERVIHELFAEVETAPSAPASAAATDDIDDLFF